MVQSTLPAQLPAPLQINAVTSKPSQSTVAPVPAELSLTDETLNPAQRLVVLVPPGILDESEFARRIWSLASPRRLSVLYLGLCPDIEREASARRQLATLAAITRDDWASVDTRLIVGNDWTRAVRSVYRQADLIICHAEQQVANGRFKHQPLSQALLTALNAPVCALAGFCPNLPPSQSKSGPALFSWLFPIFVLVAFFGLQVRIEQLPRDWAHTALLSLSVIVEYALIGIWSYLSL